MAQKEILFSEESERMQFLADYCCVEQWKLNGLSSDSYFIENAIAINHSKRYIIRLKPRCHMALAHAVTALHCAFIGLNLSVVIQG